MTDGIQKAKDVIQTTDKALTVGQKIAAALGFGSPKVRAQAMRMWAINKRKQAKTSATLWGATRKLAKADALERKADLLDPPAATCPAP